MERHILLFEDFAKMYKIWKNKDLSRKEFEYQWVDLGLPSGTLWASTNVGSHDIFDPGLFCAWGENKDKEGFISDDYEIDLIPYNDGTITKLDDDFAYKNLKMNKGCRVPTEKDFEELIKYTNYNLIDNYENTGYNMMAFTPKGCRKKVKPTLLFLLCGYKYNHGFRMEGFASAYWSSDFSNETDRAKCMMLLNEEAKIRNLQAYSGFNIRCVKDKN